MSGFLYPVAPPFNSLRLSLAQQLMFVILVGRRKCARENAGDAKARFLYKVEGGVSYLDVGFAQLAGHGHVTAPAFGSVDRRDADRTPITGGVR
jgi:hypothetical protein